MKPVRALSAFLYYLAMLLSVLYLLTGLHVLIAVLFDTPAFEAVREGKFFNIYYPFTKQPFLIGDNTRFYITEMVLILLLYGIFFGSLGNVFKTFRSTKIFTPTGVRRLSIFYLLNLTIPVIFLIVHLIISYEVDSTLILTMLHAVLGVFAYFMTAIFKQGLKLQNEQDLFI